MTALSEKECWELLERERVGRLGTGWSTSSTSFP